MLSESLCHGHVHVHTSHNSQRPKKHEDEVFKKRRILGILLVNVINEMVLITEEIVEGEGKFQEIKRNYNLYQ